MDFEKSVEYALNRAFSNTNEDNKKTFEAHAKKWFDSHTPTFKAEKKGSTAIEITIMDVIGQDYWSGGGVTAKSIRRVLDENPNVEEITILLDSPGGDVFDGVAIHSLLRRSKAKVTVEILGEASSAASIIAMAGTTIKMHVGSTMMIHRASTMGYGNAESLRETAEVLEALDSGLIDIYVARNKTISREDIKSLVDKETWMTCQVAIEKGFADELITEAPKSATTGKPKIKNEASPVGADRSTASGPIVININGDVNPEAIASEVKNALATALEAEPETAPKKVIKAMSLEETLSAETGYTAEEIKLAKEFADKTKAERERKKREEYLASHPMQRAKGEVAPPFGGMKSSR